MPITYLSELLVAMLIGINPAQPATKTVPIITKVSTGMLVVVDVRMNEGCMELARRLGHTIGPKGCKAIAKKIGRESVGLFSLDAPARVDMVMRLGEPWAVCRDGKTVTYFGPLALMKKC